VVIDDLNAENNYNPLLSISNKPVATYQSVFENFILFFNEKIEVQENAHNYLNRGIFYSLTGDYNSAFADLDKAIALDEKISLAYFTRANTRYKLKEQVELLAGVGSNNSLTLNEGKINDNSNEKPSTVEYQEILDDYAVTLFLDPDFFFGYYNRAFIKLRLGEYRSAVEDLNRAIDLEPEFAEAYFNRGLTKIFLDDIEGGAMDLSRAGELGIGGAYNIIKRYCN
jgi:tetratricopeptide (TPR) repeat protein